MGSREQDEAFLRRALDMARQNAGLSSPNPCVGAVILDNEGRVVGEGAHTFAGVKHAEVLALEQAAEKARGGILYINFEPCSHEGRTGPCADALIAAGIRRVVACMQDPNPKVSGRGFERLRNAGVSVASGILEEEAKALNEAFAKYIRHQTPLVTLKAAMTLDGKIAPPPSESHHSNALGGGGATGGWVTSEIARAHEPGTQPAELAFRRIRKGGHEPLANAQTEHRVAQELQPFIIHARGLGIGLFTAERAVGQGLAQQLGLTKGVPQALLQTLWHSG